MSRLIVSLLAMLALLGGCIESRTVVRVDADGSAVVEQVAYWKEMTIPGMPGGDEAQKLTAEKLREQCEAYAARMGQGVSVKSSELLAGPGGRIGARVIYAVPDVGQLRIGMIPDVGPFSSDDMCRFEFEKTADGGRLGIVIPPLEPPPGSDAPQEEALGPVDQMMAQQMMASMLDGVVIELQVQFNGTITKTGARHVSPRKDAITLVRADLNAMSKDRPAMKQFMDLQKVRDPQEIVKKLQSPPFSRYIQLEEAERVEVEFRRGAVARPAMSAAPAGGAAPAKPATDAPPDEARARSAMSIARNFALNKRPDLARDRYQMIIEQYPGTEYAEEAKKAMAELPEK
jgi:hypothetical protein